MSVTQTPPGRSIYVGQNDHIERVGLRQWNTELSVALKQPDGGRNQTGTNLVLTNVHANNSGDYAVAVSNAFGVVTSSVAALNVVAGPPIIIQQPAPAAATRYVTGHVMFTVSAAGTIPISYQWQYENTPISGATTASLSLTGLQASNSGSYNVVVINPHGTNISSNAVLTVTAPPADYPAAIVSLGPQAYWRLNDTAGTTANDYIGDSAGTTVGGVTHNAPGPSAPAFPGLESNNVAFVFDGTNWDVATPLTINGNQGTFGP